MDIHIQTDLTDDSTQRTTHFIGGYALLPIDVNELPREQKYFIG